VWLALFCTWIEAEQFETRDTDFIEMFLAAKSFAALQSFLPVARRPVGIGALSKRKWPDSSGLFNLMRNRVAHCHCADRTFCLDEPAIHAMPVEPGFLAGDRAPPEPLTGPRIVRERTIRFANANAEAYVRANDRKRLLLFERQLSIGDVGSVFALRGLLLCIA